MKPADIQFNENGTWTEPVGQLSAEWPKQRKQVMEVVHQYFKPEFLNRVDDIIIFNPLHRKELMKIVELRLEDLRRLLADRKISIELTDKAKELVFAEGYDVAFGARPLNRSYSAPDSGPAGDEDRVLDGKVMSPAIAWWWTPISGTHR